MRREEASLVYGMVAEFSDPEEIVVAAHRAREAGYRRIDAYTPFPVHGLAEAIGFEDNRVPWMIFLGGIAGCVGGFGLQAYINLVEYRLNVGGRPLVPWPSFIPVTFECTVLLAAFVAVFGVVIGLNGLPRPHHPIFNAQDFSRASQDRFFLCVESTDPNFDHRGTKSFLESLGAEAVSEVER